MTEALTFCNAGPEDMPRIEEFRGAFFESNPARSQKAGYYLWKLFNNPAQHGDMWIARQGELIVSMKSMTPKKMNIFGMEVMGAELGDAFTHPDYQRRGIFTTLFKVARENGLDAKFDFIYGTPNEVALPAYEKRLNYSQVPIRIHSRATMLKSKKILKSRLHSGILATFLAPATDAVFRLVFSIGKTGASGRDIGVTVETSFPDDIDAFWQRICQNYDVIVARNKSYLNWRFVANPDAYSILIARNISGDILGYLVVKVTIIDGVIGGIICDFLTLEDERVFIRLLEMAKELFRSKQVEYISAWVVKNSLYDRLLSRVGFIVGGRVRLICLRNDLGIRVLTSRCRWHFTMGDSDNI